MLRREEIASVYRQVLGREAAAEEIDAHLGGGVDSLEEILRLALDSEEYAQREREQAQRRAHLAPTFANSADPELARFAAPPGTRSEDGVAIVGREGWLFLCGGNNDPVSQHRGAHRLPPEWLDGWRRLIAYRLRSAAELGIDLAMTLHPDKLAVYERHFPEPIERVGPNPLELLLDGLETPVVDVQESLAASAASGEDVFLRTDTHLSFRGAGLLASATMRALGAAVPPGLAATPLRTFPVAGDLGARFEPRIVGLYSAPEDLGGARVSEDNWERISAAGGHLGTRRVFVNESAPDPRTLVVFGGSNSFAGPGRAGLCWFYAQAFREVHFVWFPFGWDSAYLQRVGAEAAVAAGGDRLLVRIPRPDVDTAALAEETIRSGRPVGVERVLA